VCEGGVVRTCAEVAAPDLYCDACGCGAGMVCNAGAFARCDRVPGCLCYVPQPVGAPCDADYQCESRNCSTFAGVCRVAVGAPCTTADCDRCYVYTSGRTFCSRQCELDEDCPSALCLGNRDLDYFDCHPRCNGPTDPSCSTSCQAPGGGGDPFCTCPPGGCTIEEPPRARLAPCELYARVGSCATGICLGRRQCDALAFCKEWGYCADACTTDAECGAAGVCTNVPCGADMMACGLHCLPRCATDEECEGRGTCRDFVGVGGTAVRACTVRLPRGAGCQTDRDCISGACVAATCT
jgi:hypothetical protein